MSSPIHYNDGSDPIVRYAPPHARQQGRAPSEAAAPPLGRPSQPPPADAADDRAIIEMRRRLTLEPNRVPEPPQDVAPWPLALQASIALAAAAVVAWVVTALPSAMHHGRTAVAAASPRAPVWANSWSTIPNRD